MNYLLPFAFSNSAQNTPFYAFIDSNNIFHFKSFNSMFNSTPLKEITYGTDGIDIIANGNIFYSVNFSQLELSKIKKVEQISNSTFLISIDKHQSSMLQ
jgi:hypothetical protein